jgi:hypothetical protein
MTCANLKRRIAMRRTTTILVLAAITVSSATAAFAQRYQEQMHWYDRNAVGQNVSLPSYSGSVIEKVWEIRKVPD